MLQGKFITVDTHRESVKYTMPWYNNGLGPLYPFLG